MREVTAKLASQSGCRPNPLGERVPQTPYFYEFWDKKTGGLEGLLQRSSGLAPSRSKFARELNGPGRPSKPTHFCSKNLKKRGIGGTSPEWVWAIAHSRSEAALKLAPMGVWGAVIISLDVMAEMAVLGVFHQLFEVCSLYMDEAFMISRLEKYILDVDKR
ncbi:MAG: hypothetical protein L3J67_11315, partial [Hyphomicrobiaceae bacterium]|nr:hypothetical protein [Hyphomicrobiaceae bacterium]